MNQKNAPSDFSTKESGYVFVSNGMQPYYSGQTNAGKIYELTENMYVSGLLHQLTNLVIQSDISLTVYNEKDDVVEDISRKLNQMFSTSACNISSIARSAFQDLVIWGISLYNWIWEKKGGEIICSEIRRLPPYSFSLMPNGVSVSHSVFGRLLKGIYYSFGDKNMHYCQSMNSRAAELPSNNLFVVRDTASASPDGDSLILPLAPVIEFLNYTWNALGQQMYRTGAPIMFIKIENPAPSRMINGQYIEGDVEFADKILQTWGKDTPFTLRENMTVSTIDVKEGSLAISSITKAGETIRDFISPAGLLGKDGTLIAGNSDATLRLVNSNVHGWMTLLKNSLRELPNYYLKANRYPEKWHAEVNIDTAVIEDRSQKLAEAQVLAGTRVASPNEIREMFGLEGVSEKELIEIGKQWDLLEKHV